jgi:hypothetical protein
LSEANEAPAALAAFLQGVERRAWLLAWAQCGSVEGERALAGALRAFRTQASDWPMADWPLRFWKLLSATRRCANPPEMPAGMGVPALGHRADAGAPGPAAAAGGRPAGR